jgi:uncharacterized protein (UPF0303 family)
MQVGQQAKAFVARPADVSGEDAGGGPYSATYNLQVLVSAESAQRLCMERRTVMKETKEELHRVEQEEKELIFESFGNEEAIDLGLEFLKTVREQKLPVTVDIERSGQRLFHFAAAGSSVDSANWIERKKNLVKTVFKSSYAMHLRLSNDGKTLEDLYDAPMGHFAAHGGCFPIVVKGTGFVGTITVSGLPQREDHDLVVKTIRVYFQKIRSV